MATFSKQSQTLLITCHPLIQAVCHRAIEQTDFSVVYGRRTRAEQARLVAAGFSKTMNSLHVAESPDLSRAVDLSPYIKGLGRLSGAKASEYKYFYFLGGYVKASADRMGIPLTWGGDWDGDGSFDDQNFHDLFHFQLDVEKCRDLGIYEGPGLVRLMVGQGFSGNLENVVFG